MISNLTYIIYHENELLTISGGALCSGRLDAIVFITCSFYTHKAGCTADAMSVVTFYNLK